MKFLREDPGYTIITHKRAWREKCTLRGALLLLRLQVWPVAFLCSIPSDCTDVAGAVCIAVDKVGLVTWQVVLPKGAFAVTAASKPYGNERGQ
jgi:hypothetical protein